ncbi:hypothetical protein FGLOB1_12345 [Fusarium globosum]|uniref:Uncharacterized protein n=1 Tax=Fusarium globosum TaxID=78864 RepID=A0A8H5XQQ1_9HYPO|nr:hypothetical protein FGLOB1_12345 [Fusarium globosum]
MAWIPQHSGTELKGTKSISVPKLSPCCSKLSCCFYLADFRTPTVAFELSIDRRLIQHGLEDLTLLMHIYLATLGILCLDKGLVICNIGGKKERFERGSHALWSELESADATCDLHTIGYVSQDFYTMERPILVGSSRWGHLQW